MPEVTEYRIGNTIIRVFDDACRKSQSEIEEILLRISRFARFVRPVPDSEGQAQPTDSSPHRH